MGYHLKIRDEVLEDIARSFKWYEEKNVCLGLRFVEEVEATINYISKYPELKGKDPQERTWENIEKYLLIGSTVHKVVAEVDSGALEREWIVENTCTSKEEVYNTLRKTSLEAWLYFLKGKL